MNARRDFAQRGLEALRRGDPDALDLLDRALELTPSDPQLLIAQAEAGVAAAIADPLRKLETAVATNPDWVEGHALLSGLRFELGETSRFAASFEDALRRSPADNALWNGYINTLVGAGDPLAAANAARAAGRSSTFRS
ncbi:MAG: hypothetical protein M3Q57_06400 [Pseudomonadota bacterium]|nr:hypothetical protein [Pseudomonadota bacterium]